MVGILHSISVMAFDTTLRPGFDAVKEILPDKVLQAVILYPLAIRGNFPPTVSVT
ncbi:hypothetical protein D3C81_2171940 [compost metagenome]